MSRADLSPTALAELEIGSQQDHNARHAENVRRTREQHAPLVSWPAFTFFFTLGVAALGTAVLWWALGGKL